MSMFQVSVFVENKEGRLADITKVLADNNINIRALSIADTTNFGILRLIVDDPQKAEAALKANNFTVSLTHVIAIEIQDVPGGLLQALDVLNSANISIEYMYAFIGSTEGKAAVVMRVEDRKTAAELFEKNGFKTIEG
ncbi:MAG: hypothetical protein DBX47_02090 [Clostridiales bacterium]|nr:MAG: hypothetical protein DBX47_02090 [Clostridiales bacterium]